MEESIKIRMFFPNQNYAMFIVAALRVTDAQETQYGEACRQLNYIHYKVCKIETHINFDKLRTKKVSA